MADKKKTTNKTPLYNTGDKKEMLKMELEEAFSEQASNALKGGSKYMDPHDRSKMEGESSSPLKRLNVNPYSGNYSALSEAVGSNVDDAVKEIRDREDQRIKREAAKRAEMEAKQNQLLRHQKIVKGIEEQQDYLNSSDDVKSGLPTYDQSMHRISRQIADDANALTASLNNGDIDMNEYARRYGEIRAQIPELKLATETLNTVVTDFKAIDPKDISNAQDPQKFEFLQRLSDGDPAIDIEVRDGIPTLVEYAVGKNGKPVLDEDGKPKLKLREDGKPVVDIPISEIGKMPKILKKTDDPYQGLETIVDELEKVKNSVFQKDGNGQIKKDPRTGLPIIADPNWSEVKFNQQAEETVKRAFDSIVDKGGVHALKSLAKDYYKETEVPELGISLGDLDQAQLKQILEAEPQNTDEYSSRLEEILEGAYVNDARLLFNERDIFDAAGARAQQNINIAKDRENRQGTNTKVIENRKKDWIERLRSAEGDGDYQKVFAGQQIQVGDKKQAIDSIGFNKEASAWEIRYGGTQYNEKGQASKSHKLSFSSQKSLNAYLYGQGQNLGNVGGNALVAPNSYGQQQQVESDFQNDVNNAIQIARGNNNQ